MTKVDFYKQQIKLEQEIIAKAEKSVAGMKNPLVAELILGIALDSKKHAHLLTALIKKASESVPFISESVSKELKKNLEEHIKLEQTAIDTYKKLLEEVEDERELEIIRAIYQDELRHHQLLERIHSSIVEKETLDQETMFDMFWKDAVFHGAPGG